MHITYGPVASIVAGTMQEITFLRQLLTFNSPLQGPYTFLSGDNAFPSGMLPFVVRSSYGYLQLQIDNPPTPRYPSPVPAGVVPGYTLYDWQQMVVARAMTVDRGIVALPTGAGKTLVAAAILHLLGLRSLTVIGQNNHAVQLQKKYEEYGLGPVGLLGGGGADTECRHTVGVAATVSNMACRGDPFLSEIDVLIFDEVHHVGTASTWQNVAFSCPAKYRYGLSATPFEKPDNPYSNFEDVSLIALIGEIIVELSVSFVRERGNLAPAYVFMHPVQYPEVELPEERNLRWQVAETEGIVEHITRNRMLWDLVAYLYSDPNTRILVLVQRIQHGDMLASIFSHLEKGCAFLSGGDRSAYSDGQHLYIDNDRYEELLDRFKTGESRLLIGSRVYDEVVDIPDITDLVMAGGGKKVRRTKQRVGRSLRGTSPVRIWDFFDDHCGLLGYHSRQREQTYRDDGHVVEYGFPHLRTYANLSVRPGLPGSHPGYYDKGRGLYP